MKTFVLLPVTLLFFLVSCNQKVRNKNSESEIVKGEVKDEKEQLERLKALDFISKKYEASIAFDTVFYNMTYQFQDLIEQNNRIIFESSFKIVDIEKIDSAYLTSIVDFSLNKKFFKFSCTEDQVQALLPEMSRNSRLGNRISDKILVIKINSVEKIKLKVDHHAIENNWGEIISDVYLSDSNFFMFTGELIDVFLK